MNRDIEYSLLNRFDEWKINERKAREGGNPFHVFPYTERHLQCLWVDARFRPQKLVTEEGEEVEVEYPGDWNLEAGPDFLRASLRIGTEKRLVRGDLEIHIHPSDWVHHGHTDDPRYEEVRFHVVYFPGKPRPGLIQISLRDVLAQNPSFSFESIDLSAYPYSVPEGDFPLQELDVECKKRWLEWAGVQRLRQKTERFLLALEKKEPEQLLWEELMAGLGYKKNKIAFRQLAVQFPIFRLRSLAQTPDEAYALLLGLSGLLPPTPSSDWDIQTRRFIRKMWDVWWKQNDRVHKLALKKSDWDLSGLRPQNHPVRRLMAAAHYVFQLPEIAKEWERLIDFPPNFWTEHLSWKRSCKPLNLVGKSRANSLIINVLVPFCAATGAKEINLSTLPIEPSNSIIRQSAYALFGPDHSPKMYGSALARQGLIHAFHTYLIPRRMEELKQSVQVLNEEWKEK